MAFILVFLAIQATQVIMPARAGSTIYITSDYTFPSDIYEEIVVEADNIVIDGNGYTLQAPVTGEGSGFFLNGRSNVTIKNVIIKGWGTSIYGENSSHNNISGNTISSNVWSGIGLGFDSNNNTISGNTISNCGTGIYGENSSHNNISGNTISSIVWSGIAFRSSTYNTISGNMISNSSSGIGLESSSHNNTISGNTISSIVHSGIYVPDYSSYNNISGNTIFDGGTGISLDNSAYNNISDNNVSSNVWNGIDLDNSSHNNTISGNNLTGNSDRGIVLVNSPYNTINSNILTSNYVGIDVTWSPETTIINNTATNNENLGIGVYDSPGNTLRGNKMTGNRYGFSLWSERYLLSDYLQDIDTSNTIDGKPIYYWVNQHDRRVPVDAGTVFAVNSVNITVENLNLTNTDVGVTFANTTGSSVRNVTALNNLNGIWLIWSSDNTISNCTISSGVGVWDWAWDDKLQEWVQYYWETYGISLEASSINNTVYHNNLINNDYHAWDDNPASNNWHHPVLLEGNYWDDYPGVDDGSGTGKHAIAGDGIGDTDIPWPGRNYDYYPFVHESSWIDTTPPVTELTIGTHYADALGNIYVVSTTGFTLTATDFFSGVAHTYHRINYGGWIEDVGAFTLVGSEGDYTIDYYSVDVAGNQEAIKSATVTLTTLRINVDSYFTDSKFNPVTYFDVIFLKDKTAGYRLVATNPGSLYYNIEVTNNWTDTLHSLTFEANLPTDFVLKGAVPIHVYLDDTDVTGTTQISGNLITVTNVPVGSKVYVTIHIDYALKGTTYTSLDDFELKGYIFDATVLSSESTATLIAHTKKTTAIAGFVTDADGNPIQDAIVKLFDANDNFIATTVTNEDGFYYFINIPAGDYTVQATYHAKTDTQTATAVSKTLTQVNFKIE